MKPGGWIATPAAFVIWMAAAGQTPAFADGFGRGFIGIFPKGAFSGAPFFV